MNADPDSFNDIRRALRNQADAIESTPPHLNDIVARAGGTTRQHPTRVRRRQAGAGLTVGIAVLAASGIVAANATFWPNDAVDYRAADRSPELSNELADGRVTLDEYRDGFDRYRDCATAAGVPLANVGFDAATSLFTFVRTSTVADEDCYIREFYALDVIWQLDQTRPGFNETTSFDDVTVACRSGTPLDDVTLTPEQFRTLCDYALNIDDIEP